MNEIGLGEALDALRTELSAAVERSQDADIQFPVEGVQLEFQVGVRKAADGKGGVKFWVVELGGGTSYESESKPTVTVTLGAPVDRAGTPIKVSRRTGQRP